MSFVNSICQLARKAPCAEHSQAQADSHTSPMCATDLRVRLCGSDLGRFQESEATK